jgi:protein gp37
MADRSAIEWTNATWNPVTGCTKISRGCDNCYAERLAERFSGVAGHSFETGFDLTLRPERLDQPRKWRRPLMIFVNSMSDLFHKDIPPSYVDRVFDTMEQADWHTYQVLTKRSSRMRSYVNRRYMDGKAPSHVWLGVSVEDGRCLSRVAHLQHTAASIRFLSLEPLIGPLENLNLAGIHWASSVVRASRGLGR